MRRKQREEYLSRISELSKEITKLKKQTEGKQLEVLKLKLEIIKIGNRR